MERLTRIELDDYLANAGLKEIQQKILKMRYFDPKDYSVVQICQELNISEGAFYKNRNKMLYQIDKYERQKRKQEANGNAEGDTR